VALEYCQCESPRYLVTKGSRADDEDVFHTTMMEEYLNKEGFITEFLVDDPIQ
jgi:hypothetical protein